MKLLFVYIHQYKSLKKQKFNLCSDYDIEFNYNYDDKEGYLSGNLDIKRKSSPTPKYFNKSFVDVKGVIGENGSGKSSLLQYLGFEMHAKEFDFFKVEKYFNIAVIEENETIKILAGNSWKDIFQIHVGDLDKEIKFLDNNPTWFDISNSSDIIYYSNVFDKGAEFGANDLINISTNYKLSKSGDNNFAFYNNNQLGHKNDTSLSTFFQKEMMEMVRFSASHHHNIPFEVPANVTFNAQGGYINKLISLTSSDQESKGINKWISLVKDLRSGKSNEKFKPLENFLQVYFFSYVIFNLIQNSGLESHFENYSNFKNEFISLLNKSFAIVKEDVFAIDLPLLIEEVKAIEKNYKSTYGSTLDTEVAVNISSKIEALLNFQNYLKTGIQDSDIRLMLYDFEINRNKVQKALDLYEKTIILGDYLSYRFHDLSSGELGMLTLFSRFNAITEDETRTNNRRLRKDLVILIDEGDLYFHPAWQKQYLALINKVFPEIFKKNNIQLILTSHSPFIASDLTKDHLLFMEKGKGVTNPNIDRTFAANIHELLSESFFLKGAHIGALAKEVIEKIIDKLDDFDTNNNDFTEEDLEKLIPLIGEEWIRRQLVSKFRIVQKHD